TLRHVELDLDRIQIDQPGEERVPGDDLAGADVARAHDAAEGSVNARVLELAFAALNRGLVQIERRGSLIVFLLRDESCGEELFCALEVRPAQFESALGFGEGSGEFGLVQPDQQLALLDGLALLEKNL